MNNCVASKLLQLQVNALIHTSSHTCEDLCGRESHGGEAGTNGNCICNLTNSCLAFRTFSLEHFLLANLSHWSPFWTEGADSHVHFILVTHSFISWHQCGFTNVWDRGPLTVSLSHRHSPAFCLWCEHLGQGGDAVCSPLCGQRSLFCLIPSGSSSPFHGQERLCLTGFFIVILPLLISSLLYPLSLVGISL